MKWYVLAVPGGTELKICAKIICIGLTAYVPQAERLMRYSGKWNKEIQLLLPGYIFIFCRYSAEIFYRLTSISKHIHPIPNNISPEALSDEEAAYWAQINPGGAPAEISQAIQIGDEIEITSGALVGLYGKVERYNIRQKRATVLLTLFGAERRVTLSVNFIKKFDEGCGVDYFPQGRREGHS